MTTTHVDSSRYKPPDDWINAQSLFTCRERMNLSPAEVEDLTGISADQILDWENSIGVPTLKDLELLAKHYRCPVGYFFIDKLPAQYTGTVNFRGLAEHKIDSLSYTSRLKIDEFIVLAETLANIIKELNIPNNPDISEVSLNNNIKEVVEKERKKFGFTNEIREHWTVPNDAFEFWKNAIEARGVYVISLGLIVNEVRGASKWESDSPPVILVNKNDYESATGRTFTLLHEWAHLLLREPGIICDFVGFKEKAKIEHFANKFAAEMMVSKAELSEYLKTKELYKYKPRWGDSDIDIVKNHFKVSRDVIAISLESLNLAPYGFYKTKRAQWDKRKPYFISPRVSPLLGKTKIRRRYQELGRPYSNLILDAYMNSSISMTNLSKVLGMKVDKFPDFARYVKANR
jgi:Zn-dependent peptidase ImmA (M78 family)